MSGIAAALVVIPPWLPIDENVMIAPSGHHDYNRMLQGGRGINIEVVILEGVPAGSAQFLWFSVLDLNNYTLRMNGSSGYFTLFRHEAYSGVVISWMVPSDGSYFFVLENPCIFGMRVSVRIIWGVDWLPLLYVGIVLSVAAAIFAVVRDITYAESYYVPRLVKLRGDLVMVPDVVKHAPERLDYIVIIGPNTVKCVSCGKDIPLTSEKCVYCGARQTGGD